MTDKLTVERALLQQALDALDTVSMELGIDWLRPEFADAGNAATALREALAAPQPAEPSVEKIKVLADEYATKCAEFARNLALKTGECSMSPLAVASGDVRWALHKAIDALAAPATLTPTELAERIESGEKWAVQPSEPVGTWVSDCIEWVENPYKFRQGQKIYTTPQPQRQPLTDEQIKELCKVTWVFDTARQWVRIIEAAHGITKGAP